MYSIPLPEVVNYMAGAHWPLCVNFHSQMVYSSLFRCCGYWCRRQAATYIYFCFG